MTRHHKERFYNYSQGDGLAGPLVEAVCEDAGGNLWVVTSGGLNCLKDGKIAATFTVRDGLPGNSITSLCAADSQRRLAQWHAYSRDVQACAAKGRSLLSPETLKSALTRMEEAEDSVESILSQRNASGQH